MGVTFGGWGRSRDERFRPRAIGNASPSNAAAMELERGDAYRPAGSNVPLIVRLV